MTRFRYLFLCLVLLAGNLFADGTLTPGTQTFPEWAATTVPAQQGNSSHLGYAYKPMAKWEDPSFQVYDAPKVIGVYALHPCGSEAGITGKMGIEKVRFIANNGTPLDVTTMTQRPDNGRWGFWCTLQNLASNGPVEVRPIIYPVSGLPFILQGNYRTVSGPPNSEESLVLWSNSNVDNTYTRTAQYISQFDPDGAGPRAAGNDTTGNGTALAPWATISKAFIAGLGRDGNNGYILCEPGTYQMPLDGGTATTRSRWLTIRPAPSVTRSQVIINEGTNGTNPNSFRLVRLQDVTVDRSCGLDPALWISDINDNPTSPKLAEPIPPAGTVGRWFSVNLTGTLTDPDAPVAINKNGYGWLYDNGTAWVFKQSNAPFRGNSTGDVVCIWLDGCDLKGRGVIDGASSEIKGNTSCALMFHTNSPTNRGVVRDWLLAESIKASSIYMGVDVTNMSGDLCNVPWARDLTFTGQHAEGSVHGDGFQFSGIGGGTRENVIFADIRGWNCEVNWIFMTDVANPVRRAIVNSVFGMHPDKAGGNFLRSDGSCFWFNTIDQTHDLIVQSKNGSELPNGADLSVGTSYYGNIFNFSFVTKYASSIGEAPMLLSDFPSRAPGLSNKYGHATRSSSWNPGSTATFGTATYRNAAAGDFYPTGPAAITDRIVPAIVPYGINGARGATTYQGAYDYDGTTSSTVEAPVFVPVSGSYESARTVSITSGTPGSTIYYTTNGTTPTTGSTVYTAPISVPSSATIKALAFKFSLTSSAVITQAYTIDPSGKPAAPINQVITPLDHP